MIQKNSKKEFINTLLKGFTLMELIVGIIIASIATLAILYSVLYVQSSSYELRIKERAYEELKSYTDLWKAKITGRDFPESGSSQRIKDVCLDENLEGTCVNEATIASNVIIPASLNSNSFAQRRGLISEITWEARNGSSRNISFYLEQLILPEDGDSNDE